MHVKAYLHNIGELDSYVGSASSLKIFHVTMRIVVCTPTFTFPSGHWCQSWLFLSVHAAPFHALQVTDVNNYYILWLQEPCGNFVGAPISFCVYPLSQLFIYQISVGALFSYKCPRLDAQVLWIFKNISLNNGLFRHSRSAFPHLPKIKPLQFQPPLRQFIPFKTSESALLNIKMHFWISNYDLEKCDFLQILAPQGPLILKLNKLNQECLWLDQQYLQYILYRGYHYDSYWVGNSL